MIIKVSRDTGIRTDDLSSVPVYRYTALTSLSPRRYSTPTRRNSFKYRRWCVRGCEQCDLGYFTIPSPSLSLSLPPYIAMKGTNSWSRNRRRESRAWTSVRSILTDSLSDDWVSLSRRDRRRVRESGRGGAGGCGESGSAERVQEWIAEFLE